MDDFLPYLYGSYAIFIILLVAGIVLIAKKKYKILGIILLIIGFAFFSLGIVATAFGGILSVCGSMYGK